MTYEFDELILTNKMLNMSLSELFSLDVVKAVENITGQVIDLEQPSPVILTNLLKIHSECFKMKIEEARQSINNQTQQRRVG